MLRDNPLMGFKNLEIVGNPIHLESAEAISSYNWPNLSGDVDQAYLLMMALRLVTSSNDKYLYLRMNGVAPTGPWWEYHYAGHNNTVKSHDVVYGNDYLTELGINRTANNGNTWIRGYSLIFTPKGHYKSVQSKTTRKNDVGSSISFNEMVDATAENGITANVTSIQLHAQCNFYGDFALYKLGI